MVAFGVDPTTDHGPIAKSLASSDADAFVHVGDRFDDDLRYLTRFSGPDRPYAFVHDGEESWLLAPSLFGEQARREFPGDHVRTPGQGTPPTAGQRAAALLDELSLDGPLLVPRQLPHDAALYLERAGFELASTPVVERMRESKTAVERARIASVQHVAEIGMSRAEAILAESTPDGSDLRWRDEPLTTERLRRGVNAAMVAEGVAPAGNTVIGSGPTCADLHYTGDVPIRPGETVLLDLSPRGPAGYYGDLSRTFVVDPEGGWERRAHVAVRDAQDAALAVLESGAGVRANRVHEEAAAEIRAHGFEVGAVETGFYHGTGHGVGVSLHEPPSLTGSEPLRAGCVVTVEPGVYDPELGGVRIEDLVVVTDDGYENLTDYHRRLVPSEG